MSTITDVSLSAKAVSALEGILRNHRKELKDDLEKLANTASRSGSGIGYGNIPQHSDPKKQKVELDKFIKALGGANKNLTAYERFLKESLRAQRAELVKQIKETEKSTEAVKDNTGAVEDNTDAQTEHTSRVKEAADTTKRFIKGLAEGTLYIKGLEKAVSEFQTSYRLGFKWEPIMDALNGALMGMDPKAMMEFQAQFRRTSGAMADGIDGFNKVVSANQLEMIQYTGSMQAAAQAMGNMYELSHNMGLRLDDVAGSADSLFTQFKKMQAVTSITVDQFVEMNQRMLSNSDIQGKLLRLNQTQRAQYIQGLNQQQLALQMMGLQKEVAEGLIAATEQMSGKKGIDRYQDSVKTAIMLQAGLGMDRESAMRVGMLKNKTHKTEAEATELQKAMLQISEMAAQRKNTGVGIGGVTTSGEVTMDALLEHLGQEDFINAGTQGALQQSAATNGGALLAHQTELAERQIEPLQQIAKYTSAMADMLGAWSGTAAAVLAGAVVATLLNRFKVVEWAVGRIMGGGLGDVGPGGSGPGGSPGGAGGRGGKLMNFLKGNWKGLAGGAAGLGIGVAGNLAAELLLDPNNASVGNRQATQQGQTALSWGATGAGLGAVMGPLGMAAGGAIGGLAGYLYEVNKYSKDFGAQMKDSLAIGSQMLSSEQIKLKAEKDSKLEQIKALEQQGELTSAQHELLKKMRGEVEGINASMGVADIKQQAMGASMASKFIDKMLTDGANISDTGDIANNSAQLQTMLQMAGVKGNVNETLIAKMRDAALNDGVDSSMFNQDYVNMNKAIMAGEDADIPMAWRKYANDAFASTAQGYQREIGLEMASTRGGAAAGGILSTTVTSQQADVAKAAERVKTLEDEITKMKEGGHLSYRDGGRDVLNAKEKELAQAREVLAAQKSAADALTRSASGEAPLYMKWSQEDMKALADTFAASLKSSSRTAAAYPQGMGPLKM